MRHILAIAARTIDTVASGMALAAIVLVCVEATTRYLAPRYSVDWGTEVIIFLLVWATMFMAGRAAFENRHVAATVIVELLPKPVQSSLFAVAILLGVAFGIVLIIFGWDVVAFSQRLNILSDSSLRFPKAWYYMIIPLAGALLVVGYALRLWLFARHAKHRLPPRHGPGEGNS
ncbi:TRAP transporter small permease [uncultured Ruegeria sp.]|uniref:TRAP transporter small permease n=1 Tax=uncultured Ruegeria sp. TaxID=259304 RepID=UPI0026251E48|nr:TRAP transporter small permease [uncultured Ruegeria sp.]